MSLVSDDGLPLETGGKLAIQWALGRQPVVLAGRVMSELTWRRCLLVVFLLSGAVLLQ